MDPGTVPGSMQGVLFVSPTARNERHFFFHAWAGMKGNDLFNFVLRHGRFHDLRFWSPCKVDPFPRRNVFDVGNVARAGNMLVISVNAFGKHGKTFQGREGRKKAPRNVPRGLQGVLAYLGQLFFQVSNFGQQFGIIALAGFRGFQSPCP